ncbi:MAG: protein FdrA [Pseudonocardia sp.]
MTLHRDTYVDSVVQLAGTRAARAADGVDWASAAMATPGNLEILAAEGFSVADAGANDLVIAVRAGSDEAAGAARAAAEEAMFAGRAGAGQAREEAPPRTLRDAVGRLDGANVAVVSVPGDYAALEAHKALSVGLHVLLFSDNVPVEAEVELKDRATALDRLVMGPGAGTAMLGGACLGFANVVAPAQERGVGVAVVAAAGTGAQEAASLLDRWGVGVPHVIGLGGRDLTAAVGGRMARVALRALADDPRTDVILLVSKPPAPEVAASVLGDFCGKPLVAALIGLAGEGPDGVTVTRTLEAGAVAALKAAGLHAPDVSAGLADRVSAVAAGLPERRTLVRGLFSGGTLCYESLVVLGDLGIDTYSNTPIDKRLGLPAPDGAHQCLDLGEEEYTKGRPHPMIDPEARIGLLREHGAQLDVAAIVLDVVLGHGANLDPAAELAPVCREVTADGGPAVVVYVLGTAHDPQGLERTRAAFTDAGCLVTETAARATLAAAAIATRRPAIAETPL